MFIFDKYHLQKEDRFYYNSFVCFPSNFLSALFTGVKLLSEQNVGELSSGREKQGRVRVPFTGKSGRISHTPSLVILPTNPFQAEAFPVREESLVLCTPWQGTDKSMGL